MYGTTELLVDCLNQHLNEHLSFSLIVIEFDEFNEFEIWWCHCKKVTYI